MEVKSSIAFLPLALYLFLFFLSIPSPLFLPSIFTCRVAAAVSKGKKKKIIESIQAKRKLTTTGWLVLLFCLETNVAVSLLERGWGGGCGVWGGFPCALSELLVFLYVCLFPCPAFYSLFLIASSCSSRLPQDSF